MGKTNFSALQLTNRQGPPPQTINGLYIWTYEGDPNTAPVGTFVRPAPVIGSVCWDETGVDAAWRYDGAAWIQPAGGGGGGAIPTRVVHYVPVETDAATFIVTLPSPLRSGDGYNVFVRGLARDGRPGVALPVREFTELSPTSVQVEIPVLIGDLIIVDYNTP